jgi:hypothetical protein
MAIKQRRMVNVQENYEELLSIVGTCGMFAMFAPWYAMCHDNRSHAPSPGVIMNMVPAHHKFKYLI